MPLNISDKPRVSMVEVYPIWAEIDLPLGKGTAAVSRVAPDIWRGRLWYLFDEIDFAMFLKKSEKTSMTDDRYKATLYILVDGELHRSNFEFYDNDVGMNFLSKYFGHKYSPSKVIPILDNLPYPGDQENQIMYLSRVAFLLEKLSKVIHQMHGWEVLITHRVQFIPPSRNRTYAVPENSGMGRAIKVMKAMSGAIQ